MCAQSTKRGETSEFSERLSQFESEWQSGSVPDITAYLQDSDRASVQELSELIRRDLLYRWKRFPQEDAAAESTADVPAGVTHQSSAGRQADLPAEIEGGVPRFPQIEDYAALVPKPRRRELFVPELIAEEYRVRCVWGDRPTKESYFRRFPERRAELETVLDRMDTVPDNYVERHDANRSSQAFADHPTAIWPQHGEAPRQEHTFLIKTQAGTAISEVFGKYRLEARVGHGGFGEVWKAFDTVLQRYVAIKFPSTDKRPTAAALGWFQTEAQNLASLGHIPGVVTVFDFGIEDGLPYIVSEYIEGESLETRMQRGTMSVPDAVSLVIQVAAALHEAHRRGLVHRDIKPSNILLDQKGNAYLADFGLSVTEQEQLQERHGVVGTYAYMAPEQARGDSHRVDGRADIYALGVVLYRLLTGRYPFLARTPEKYLEQVLHQEPRPLRAVDDTIPQELERICLKCLCRTVSERYTTARDLADDLHAAQSRPRPTSLVPGMVLMAVLAAVLVGVLAAQLWRTGQTGASAGRAGDNDNRDDTSQPAAVSDASGAAAPAAAYATVHSVAVLTTPPGAEIVVYPVGERYGFPDGDRRVAAETRSPAVLELVPGRYLVIAALEDGRFHEVYRNVPEDPYALPPQSYAHFRWRTRVDGTVEWPAITIPSEDVKTGMGLFEGAPKFQLGEKGNPLIPVHHRVVPSFYLDPHEVSWGEFLDHNSGQAPASLHRLRGQLPDRNMPIAGIWYDDALMYAEKVGKRLPTEAEYEFAATLGGRRKFPWGDSVELIGEQWTFGPVGTPEYDRVDVGRAVFGLYSNVAEWTCSWGSPYPPRLDYQPAFPGRRPGHYIVRGGPYSVIQRDPDPSQFSAGPRARISLSDKALEPGLGFRCARSLSPRLQASDLERIVSD